MMKANYQIEQTDTIEASEKKQIVSQTGNLKVQIYDTEDSFEALSALWHDLSERVNGHIYMSNEWAECWWRYFGKNNQRTLFLVTIWDLDDMVGLAPMYIGYSKVGPFVVERRLQIIGSGGSPNEQFGYLDDYGISDFLDFLVDENHADEAADVLLELFRSEEYKIDRITFHQAGDESFIMKYIYPRIKESGIEYDLQHTDTCPFIDVNNQESILSYIKQVKSNARRRFRQTRRAIGIDDGFTIESIDTSREITIAIEKLIKLHQNRWNQLGFPGVFYDKRFTGFFKEIVRSAYTNNWLWFKQARDSSGACAFRMILKYNDRYYDYISGFDNDCPSSKYRPGIGLLLDLVEEAIHEKTERIELLRGEEEYKYDFTTENFKNWRLTFTPVSRKNNIASLATLQLKLSALLFKYTTREFRLLNVQYQQQGWAKMFWGYLSFRTNSLRMKLKS
jgi:hypothetical protein